MFLKVFAILFVGFISTSSASSCEAVKCPRIPTHYEELGCKPIVTGSECCPSSYDCSTYNNRDPTKCYYKNQVINPGGFLDKLSQLCVPGCFCQINGGKASFVCSHYDCFDWSQPKENCTIMNKLDDCCRGEEVCGKQLTTCNFQGKTYNEGDMFYPEDSCHTCVCTNDFENVPLGQNKNCKKIECAIDLHYTHKLRDGCAPVYGKTKCCPYYWQCPSDKDNDVVVRAKSINQSGKTCKFGKLTLEVGDQINIDSEKSCSCLEPPMVECKHLSN